MRPEQVCGLHGTSTLRAKDAFDHDASPQVECPAIVAEPFIVGDLVDAIASLMYGYIASSTKDNEVLILVVSIVADCALSVLLHNQASLVRAQ